MPGDPIRDARLQLALSGRCASVRRFEHVFRRCAACVVAQVHAAKILVGERVHFARGFELAFDLGNEEHGVANFDTHAILEGCPHLYG